jgi:hypothetical protein
LLSTFDFESVVIQRGILKNVGCKNFASIRRITQLVLGCFVEVTGLRTFNRKIPFSGLTTDDNSCSRRHQSSVNDPQLTRSAATASESAIHHEFLNTWRRFLRVNREVALIVSRNFVSILCGAILHTIKFVFVVMILNFYFSRKLLVFFIWILQLSLFKHGNSPF